MSTENQEWFVVEMNDCDWWLARTIEEATRDMLSHYGLEPDDVMEDHPKIVSDNELMGIVFKDEERDKQGRFVRIVERSFYDELQIRKKAGITSPEPFATTEF